MKNMCLAAVIFIGNGVLHVLAWVEWVASWHIVRSDVGSMGSVGSVLKSVTLVVCWAVALCLTGYFTNSFLKFQRNEILFTAGTETQVSGPIHLEHVLFFRVSCRIFCLFLKCF